MPEYTVQRFRGGWAVVYRDEGKRIRRKLYAADRAGAEAEARSRWRAHGEQEWTVGMIVEAYIDAREADGIASTSRQRDAWKAMKGFWGNVDPKLIDKDMARDYVRRRNRAEATTRYELSMLAVALRWAVRQKFLDKAPEVWRPSPPERRVRHLTRAEFDRWFREVKAPHAKLYVELGLATMARPSAILELTWDRVDWERGTVDLNPRGRRQTRKRRPVVPLNDIALEALKEAYAARQSEFVIERGSKQVKSIKKAFQGASARSGIHATPYTLRHTGSVWAIESGKVTIEELAQFLGHDDATTTSKHYARFSPDYLRKVADSVRRKPLDNADIVSDKALSGQ